MVARDSPVPVCVVPLNNLIDVRTGEIGSSVIVPLDGTELAELAIETSLELAWIFKGSLVLFCALSERSDKAERVRMQKYLNEVSEKLRKRGVSCSTRIGTGTRAEAVAAEVRAEPRTILVLANDRADWLANETSTITVIVPSTQPDPLGLAIH